MRRLFRRVPDDNRPRDSFSQILAAILVVGMVVVFMWTRADNNQIRADNDDLHLDNQELADQVGALADQVEALGGKPVVDPAQVVGGRDGLNGRNGRDGRDGRDGKDGADGRPPTAAEVDAAVARFLFANPIPDQPETQDPEIDDPDPNDPEIQDPEVDDPEVQDPEIDDPDPDGSACPTGSSWQTYTFRGREVQMCTTDSTTTTTTTTTTLLP